MISRRKFLASGITAIPLLSLQADELRPSIGAYYYPWYDSAGRHWEEGYHGKSSGRKPAPGLYSSRSPHTIRQHISWAGEMGIDHWIASWWGPESWEDHTLRRAVMPMLEQAEAAPRICLLYEAEGLLGLDPEAGIVFDSEAVETFSEHVRFLAREYFSHSSYLRFENRPVLYLYLSRAFAGNYQQALLRARAAAEAQGFDLFLVGDEVYWGAPVRERIRLFDAITPYNMHGPEHFRELEDWQEFLNECQDVYRQYGDVAREEGVVLIPGILPGFDSRDADGDHYVIPRTLTGAVDGKSTLQAYAEMVKPFLDSKYPAVAVTSFNEWHEGTQLEPSAGEDVVSLLEWFR